MSAATEAFVRKIAGWATTTEMNGEEDGACDAGLIDQTIEEARTLLDTDDADPVYTVSWGFDTGGESPRDAAVVALGAMLEGGDPAVKGNGWEVTVETHDGATVDLTVMLCEVTGRHRPDDDPEPGDRCKDCGKQLTWRGPSPNDWDVAE